jgi:hypothetical protein
MLWSTVAHKNKFFITQKKQMATSYVETNLRCFNASIGLTYQENGQGNEQQLKVWTREDVKVMVQQWIHQRVQKGQIYLSVIVSAEGSLLYPTGSDLIEEPCVQVHGEVVRPNLAVTDSKIKEAVLHLFAFLKTELKQQSIRVHFQGYHENVSIRIF